MNLTVIGTGFVGVVSAAVYASFGHQVIGLDVDKRKIESLKQSIVPFFEPNLTELLAEQQKAGRLTFTTDYQQAIQEADIVIIAVGTPSAPDGQADLKYVFMSAESLAPFLKPDAIVVVKSTVPPGTLAKVKTVIDPIAQQSYHLASVPEFLREGSAVHDTLHPNRVVIGASSDQVFEKLELLHKPLQAPVVRVKPESAQMAKYAANAYLATRITFINQIADLCEKNGADVEDVIQAIGFDQRVGSHYWYPGLGYGGSCFPKDVKELAAYSRAVGESGNLFVKVDELNAARLDRLMTKFTTEVEGWQGKKIAFLGLSFKPNTDDMREAPSTKIISRLIEDGATVLGYDPMAKPTLSQLNLAETELNYRQVETISKACEEADVIFSVVEWPQIVSFEFATVRNQAKQQWFIDARNQFEPKLLIEAGYSYIGIGRTR
jgi:UDPglucose 6-dehydrogenase